MERSSDGRAAYLPNETGNPTSGAAIVDGMIYTGGQVGMDPVTHAIPTEFEDQVRLAIANLSRMVERAGGSLETIVKARVYLTDRARFADMNRVFAECMPRPYPARCTVVAGLALEELLFEIEAVAYVREDAPPQ